MTTQLADSTLRVPRAVYSYRRLLAVVLHLALWTGAFLLAFVLRFDTQVPRAYWPLIAVWLPVAMALRTIVYFFFQLFHGMWRYTGSRDLVSLAKAATVSTVLFVLVVHFVGPGGFPRSVFIIDWLLSIFAVGGLRFGIRTLREFTAGTPHTNGDRHKILIVGAGDGGEMLVREVRKTYTSRYEPVGFVDDNTAKVGAHIHGVPVLGPIAMVPALVRQHGIDEVIVAIPSAKSKEMRRIVELCGASGARIRTIPGVDSLIDGRVTVSQIRSVAIEDLLGRDPIQLDVEAISDYVRDNVVLVTGAGGSIGSEICRQVSKYRPTKLILVEQAENNLFNIHRELREKFPDVTVLPRIADITDVARIEQLFVTHRPSVVFHAAAHKHVPMMEWNPGEAIKNNIFGTRTLADLSNAYGVHQFVMISTDKAVNPTSIMGVSKRVAEIYIQALSQRSMTRFITVRFGNVLGSAGSVVPIFQEQIARGGPVMVTHPDMKRYFMTIPEASQLVMQAGAMGKGGEIFVLDMGAPVKIVDLARDLITLSGLRPGEDIEIQFSGVRPGEKLYEELTADSENADKTRHPKILVGRFRPHPWAEIVGAIDGLDEVADATDDAAIRARFAAIVPEYHPVVGSSVVAPGVSLALVPVHASPPQGDEVSSAGIRLGRTTGSAMAVATASPVREVRDNVIPLKR